jgi:hypothetical protein
MDTTLLQKEKRATAPPAADDKPDKEKLLEKGDDGIVEVAYEELQVEAPQPPLRMHLEPAVDYDGKPYHELIFDFDALIGKDFQVAERTFGKMYRPEKNELVMPEMKHLFHCILAAQVADVPVGLIMKLPRRYYTPLRMRVKKACGSSPEEESE